MEQRGRSPRKRSSNPLQQHTKRHQPWLEAHFFSELCADLTLSSGRIQRRSSSRSTSERRCQLPQPPPRAPRASAAKPGRRRGAAGTAREPRPSMLGGHRGPGAPGAATRGRGRRGRAGRGAAPAVPLFPAQVLNRRQPRLSVHPRLLPRSSWSTRKRIRQVPVPPPSSSSSSSS